MAAVYPLSDTFGRVHCYVLDDGADLTVIDALGSLYGDKVLQHLKMLGRRPGDIRRIILTHTHLTHAKGAAALKRASGALVWAPIEERDILEGQRPSNLTTWVPKRPFRVLPQQYFLNLSHVLWKLGLQPAFLNFPAVHVDHPIDRDGQQVGPVIALKTPGHTPGSTSFYWPEMETLFAGDAVVTWPRFELGWQGLTENYRQNVQSIHRLVNLFEERGWRIKAFATGHGPIRHTRDGVAELRQLLERA
jgi:glyoxylase-like metal-dependent hydrolase (beta-lactamase superfamily II)